MVELGHPIHGCRPQHIPLPLTIRGCGGGDELLTANTPKYTLGCGVRRKNGKRGLLFARGTATANTVLLSLSLLSF
jgi:hypothetical protein